MLRFNCIWTPFIGVGPGENQVSQNEIINEHTRLEELSNSVKACCY